MQGDNFYTDFMYKDSNNDLDLSNQDLKTLILSSGKFSKSHVFFVTTITYQD